jgi:hypothetical protein
MKKLNLMQKARYCGYILLVAVLFSACDSFDTQKRTMNLQKKFPKGVVYLTDYNYSFIVIDSTNTVHYIKMTGEVNEITSDVIVKNCN